MRDSVRSPAARTLAASVSKILALLALLLLVAGFAAPALTALGTARERTQAGGPALSVTALVGAMADHPGVWSGRAVNVRGVIDGVVCGTGCAAGGTQSCLGIGCRTFDAAAGALRDGGLFYLQDAASPAGQGDGVLFIRPSYRAAWLDRIGSIPLLGSLVIPGRAIHWLVPAVYSLRVTWGVCGRGGVCPIGVLEDATRDGQ